MFHFFRTSAITALAAAALAPVSAYAATQPTLLLSSVKAIDTQAHTVVLPLHRGSSHGKTVWYVLTDVSDAAQSKARGIVFAPLLATVGATQRVVTKGGAWDFAAAPDFSPKRVFQPGATGFPPKAAAPGATAPAQYSPFVTVDGGATVYNAPIVATGDAAFDVTSHANTSDRVLAVSHDRSTVTLLLADGFAGGKRVFYISTEASDPGAATIERATLAPALGRTPQSARLRIYVVVNGVAQGLADAALRGNLAQDATATDSASLHTSQNVLGGLPGRDANGNGIYDPLWDAYPGVWTAAAAASHRNVTLTSADAVEAAASAKLLTGPGGKAFGPAGFAVNCPVIAIER